MFRVVVFTDAPEVAVISHKWWKQDEVDMHEGDKPRGIVFWPPCKTSSAVDRLLKTHAEPNQTSQSPWTRHPAISYFAADNLLVARRKAQQAEEESDLASEAEVGETSTRVRRKNPRFDDEDSEEENRSPVRRETAGLSRPPLAPRDFGLDNGTQGKRHAGSRHVAMGGSSATTPTTPTTSVPIRHRREAGLERGRTRSPEARPPMRTPVDEPSTSSSGSCAKQSTDNRILLLLSKTLKKLESIESITLQNRAAIEALKGQWTTTANKPLKVSPAQTLSELRELDERLKSRAQYLEMVEQLSGWCTMAASDLDKNVRAIMRATVSDVLSEHLSLKGKNGKTPIEGTILFDVLCETLRRCGGAERSRVGKAVGAWLSGSRDRSGKRLKRMKGVEVVTTQDNPERAQAAETPAPIVQEAGHVEEAELPPPEQRPQPNAEEGEAELPMHLW